MSRNLVDLVADGDENSALTSLLTELKTRYDLNEIYSYIGPSLISINPLKSLDGLYSEKSRLAFKHLQHNEHTFHTNQGHIWAVAEKAHSLLVQTQQSQAIILLGESGGTSIS